MVWAGSLMAWVDNSESPAGISGYCPYRFGHDGMGNERVGSDHQHKFGVIEIWVPFEEGDTKHFLVGQVLAGELQGYGAVHVPRTHSTEE